MATDPPSLSLTLTLTQVEHWEKETASLRQELSGKVSEIARLEALFNAEKVRTGILEVALGTLEGELASKEATATSP